jgi:Raf kinase inhibitor-like YbhB/YbcL family protein
LIVDDPDAPGGTWVHWVLFNFPAQMRALPEHLGKEATLASAAVQGINDFKRRGYGGPCPPPGVAHRYVFTLYALETMVSLPPNATKAQLEQAMTGHLLAQAQLIGLYQR